MINRRDFIQKSLLAVAGLFGLKLVKPEPEIYWKLTYNPYPRYIYGRPYPNPEWLAYENTHGNKEYWENIYNSSET